MKNNIINEVISELRPFTEQLEKGSDLIKEQLDNSKEVINTINDLNNFISMGGEIDDATLRGAYNYGNIIVNNLNELPTNGLNEQSNQFILESVRSTQQLLHTINNALHQNQAINQQAQATPNQLISNTKYDSLGIAMKGTKLAAGVAFGASAGFLMAVGEGVRSAAQYMSGSKPEFNSSNTEQQQASNQASAHSYNSPSSVVVSTTSDTAHKHTDSSMGKGREQSTSISTPTQSFGSFAEQQTERAFVDNMQNSLSAFSIAGELSNHDSLKDSELSNKVIKNLEQSMDKLEKSCDSLSPDSRKKFEDSAERLKESFENAEIDPSINEKIRLAMEKAIEQLKNVFSKLTGKSNDHNFKPD